MKKLDFVYFEAGGGHRAAAQALKAVIEEQQRPWQVRLVNLQEILDPLDIFRKYTGIRMQDVYNLLLKKGWTLGSPQLTVLMHGLIRLYHPSQVRLLKKFWAEGERDIVVSLVPNFNRALRQSLSATPFVTILTDLADYPPHFWIERQEQYLVCGTSKAAEQAAALGHPPERVFRTSGMILRPKFYQPVTADPAIERERLGLDPAQTTGLVLFGGEGSSAMLDIARRVTAAAQFIFVCGRNEKLAERLRRLPTRFPKYVEGFTGEIPYYMHLADFFVGKPGPGSISEALAMRLPVVVESNAWTLPQERYNTEWVRERQVGVVLKSFRDIDAGLRELLEPGNFTRFRANASAIQNRAVFEIPDILDSLLQRKSR
ncbi:MAG: galactosyldiacylglycerol synthase [Acidobacteriia bacterium]|nr:galactosyldiacylglycerol synthase [Terriglobia bacterium]